MVVSSFEFVDGDVPPLEELVSYRTELKSALAKCQRNLRDIESLQEEQPVEVRRERANLKIRIEEIETKLQRIESVIREHHPNQLLVQEETTQASQSAGDSFKPNNVPFSMADQFTDEELEDFKEGFRFYEQGKGFVDVRDLGILMRSMGVCPTDAEIDQYIFELQSNGVAQLDFPEFLSIMARQLKDETTSDDLRRAFSLFDREANGTVRTKELNHALLTIGERLQKDEIDLMMRELKATGEPYLQSEEYVRLLVNR